jgi:hypothetical protein
VWDIINPEDNFAGCRKFMDEEACLPLIFPYIMELRRSGNAPDKLLAAFQFVGYFGRRKEVEVGQSVVVGEKAGREGTSESWHGILWKLLLYNFCISCQ